MNESGFIKVRAAVMMSNHPEYVVKRHPDGSFTPSEEFIDIKNEEEIRFREPIITFINDIIPYNWAIYFTPFTDDSYDARIYCESENEFNTIVRIIKERLLNVRIQEFRRWGNVEDMKKQWP